MIYLDKKNTEFLFIFEEELESIEESCFSTFREVEFRIVSTKLRNLLHEREGSLLRAYSIFGWHLNIVPEKVSFIYTCQSHDSAAVYAVEFCDFISKEQLELFTVSKCTANTYCLAFPNLGFNRSSSTFCAGEGFPLASYLSLPIVGIENHPVTRWQLISYLSNKRGISHYSESREKRWQKLLDKYWDTQISKSGSGEKIRGPYECLQRIANEVLSCPRLETMRRTIRALRNAEKA